MTDAQRTSWLKLLGTAAMSGLLLFLSDHPLHFWPIQIMALLPWLFGLMRYCRSWAAALTAGGVLGLFLTVPVILYLEFPLLMGGGLVVYITLLLCLLSVGSHFVLRWKPVWGALGVGALAVLVEWVDFSLVPIFGTAQSFVKVWSAGPWTMQFVSLAGPLGLVFMVVAVKALLAALLFRPVGRKASGIALAALVLAGALFNLVCWTETPKGTLRVAAMGWTTQRPRISTSQVFEKHYLPMLKEAVEKGAKLVVSPETGFGPAKEELAGFRERVSQAARDHGVSLVVGYFDRESNDNRIAFVDQTGKTLAEYRKTHLIAGIERYTAGDGTLVVLPFEGIQLGGMICQDDNFTDLARGYGRKQVSVMVVPTNDWRQVKDFHFENSLFRAMENRYGIVRAATNGISAIVSARGEVLVKRDHFEKGPGVVVADLPLYPPGSIYAKAGDWLALVCLVLLVAGFLLGRLRE